MNGNLRPERRLGVSTAAVEGGRAAVGLVRVSLVLDVHRPVQLCLQVLWCNSQ